MLVTKDLHTIYIHNIYSNSFTSTMYVYKKIIYVRLIHMHLKHLLHSTGRNTGRGKKCAGWVGVEYYTLQTATMNIKTR